MTKQKGNESHFGLEDEAVEGKGSHTGYQDAKSKNKLQRELQIKPPKERSPQIKRTSRQSGSC